MLMRRLRDDLGRLRPNQPLQPDGRDAKRSVVADAEELRLQIRSRVVPQIPGPQLHLPNLFRVALQIDVRVATTLQILKREARHTLARSFT